MWADQALQRFVKDYPNVKRVLDVGSGAGEHAEVMRSHGMDVTEVDLRKGRDYNQTKFDLYFDGIWCSHVLEHQLNVNRFLTKLRYDLKVGGILAISVPPLKNAIVGGHVTLWNAGLLLYNLILAGWDCSTARVGRYDYNISVIVPRKDILDMPTLAYDTGDIELLAPYFPFPVAHGFNGANCVVNWGK